MKVYTLYLSTLTGAIQQATFSATCNGTTLTVTGTVVGTIIPLQFININGIVNQITAYITGTGTIGTYTLLNSVTNATSSTYTTYNLPNNFIVSNPSLPTLTLFVPGITFAGTISGTTTLTLSTATSSGVSLPVGSMFLLNNVYTTVTAILTGTGGFNSTYTISPPAANNATNVNFSTIASAYVTVSPSTIGVGQYIYSTTTTSLTTPSAIQIIAFGTGTGGTGSYALSSATALASQVNLVYNYTLLNSVSNKYAPNLYVGAKLSQLKWNINWREIFGNRIGNCRVRVRLISSSSTGINWANNIGSLRASFQSTCSNSTAGFNLGYIRPQSDYTSGANNTTYLDLDTTQANGSTIIIPNTNNDFYVNILNAYETTMINVPDYQLWLLFDTDDEDPYETAKANGIVPSIYNPR